MTYFDNNDPIWEETAEFLAPLIKKSSLVMGPESFVNVLPNVLAYELLPTFTPDFFDFVIIHKGDCSAIGVSHLEVWEQSYSAVFANPVFVVFAKQSLPQIDRTGDDFKSLSNQIDGLATQPTKQTTKKNAHKANSDTLNYRPVVKFLQAACSDQTLLLVPSVLHDVFPQSLDENTILKTSLDTVDLALISVNSALDFPYQDLKNIIESYTPIYSDTLFSVFTKSAFSGEKSLNGGFATALQGALQNDDYLVSLKLYRDMVTGDLS